MNDPLYPCGDCQYKEQSPAKEPCKTCTNDKNAKGWAQEVKQNV